MKKLLFVILVAIACTGCVKREAEIIAEFKTKFPDSEIRKIPNPHHIDQWLVKTPDNKMMVCCTDMARKKFKILDVQGNLKEDIEARLLCKKLTVPVKMITKEIYDTVIERIEKERDRLSSDDRSRREKLLDDSMRAQQMYMDNLNFDDLNYNQDFMHELCVLLNA